METGRRQFCEFDAQRMSLDTARELSLRASGLPLVTKNKHPRRLPGVCCLFGPTYW